VLSLLNYTDHLMGGEKESNGAEKNFTPQISGRKDVYVVHSLNLRDFSALNNFIK